MSAGNAAMVSVPDYLDFYADDPETTVGLAYVEGIRDGRAFFERWSVRHGMPLCSSRAARRCRRAPPPATPAASRPTTASSTGCAARPGSRAPRRSKRPSRPRPRSHQPLPRLEVCVVTTAGGWGVVTADAMQNRHSSAVGYPSPEALRRSSTRTCRRAGVGTTPSTSPAARRATRFPRSLADRRAIDVDAVIFLGMGIQANQGRMERAGRSIPTTASSGSSAYHEAPGSPGSPRPWRAEAISTFRQAAVLTATELSMADPSNPAVVGCRESGKLCYASANRAVTALAHLWDYARYRERRGLD